MLHNSELPLIDAPAALRGARGDVAGVRLAELADEELRLLALAVGDHGLPIEVRERIAALRAQARGLAETSARPRR